MKALVMRGPGQFGIEEVPKPVCGDREVLVQVKAVAICGSDPVLLAGGSLSDGLPGSLPHIAGHEGAGIIVQCGKDVKGFAVGDRVAVESHLGCGYCENCQAGRYNLCRNFGDVSAGHKQHGLEPNSISMIPLFETTDAIVHGAELLGLCRRIDGVQFGAEDLTKEMEIPRTLGGEEIRYAREQLIFAARANGVDSLDTPFTDVKNLEALERDVAQAKAMGFTGKTCIHPSHIEAIHRAFTPTEEEVRRAQGIVAAMEAAVAEGKGACMYENKMVDAPVAERARKIVEKAARIQAAVGSQPA